MLPIMFELPSHPDIRRCIITAETVEKGAPPRYERYSSDEALFG